MDKFWTPTLKLLVIENEFVLKVLINVENMLLKKLLCTPIKDENWLDWFCIVVLNWIFTVLKFVLKKLDWFPNVVEKKLSCLPTIALRLFDCVLNAVLK